MSIKVRRLAKISEVSEKTFLRFVHPRGENNVGSWKCYIFAATVGNAFLSIERLSYWSWGSRSANKLYFRSLRWLDRNSMYEKQWSQKPICLHRGAIDSNSQKHLNTHQGTKRDSQLITRKCQSIVITVKQTYQTTLPLLQEGKKVDINKSYNGKVNSQ